MAIPVTKTCSAAFSHLHNIRQIRRFLSHEATETLIHAFVTSKVDYCNSLLYDLPAYQIAKLQRVQNAAARLIFKESRFCHTTTLLRQLHWLPVHYRIIFKTLLIAFKAINGLGPGYLSCLVCIRSQGDIIYVVRKASSLADYMHLAGPIRHSVTAPLRYGHRNFGTIYGLPLGTVLVSTVLNQISRPIFLNNHF